MIDGKYSDEEVFMSWLSKKVSPAQLSELYMAFLEIEQQAKRAKIIEKSIYENKDEIVFKKICNNIVQNKSFKFAHKRQMGQINSALNYLILYARDSALVEENQISIKNANKLDNKSEENSAAIIKHTEDTVCTETVDFDHIPNMAFTKPLALNYFGNETQETTWRKVYIDLCKHLIEDYPVLLKQLRNDSISGKTKVWLVDGEHTELLLAPKKVMQNYYIETNYSALDIVRSIRWLLDRCSVDYKNVIITYSKPVKNNVDEQSAYTVTERKYIRDDKKSFYHWLLNEQHMAKALCQWYVRSVHIAEKYAKGHSLNNVKLFGVRVEEARKTADALFRDVGFVKKNKAHHNHFKLAITKLLEYLEEDNMVSHKSFLDNKTNTVPKTETIQVDIKPFMSVLALKFPYGFLLSSSIEIKKFLCFFEDINGYMPEQAPNDIKNIIKLCGIEHEGKIYAPQTMLSDELRDKLFNFIDKNFDEGKKVVYYEALFQKFSDDFLDQKIYDTDMLKAYIEYFSKDKYLIERSYLSKEKRLLVDPIEDSVRTCFKEYGPIMEVYDLCNKLSYIPFERIHKLLSTNKEYVRNSKGEYFYIDSFSVSDEELECISSLINEELKKHEFISGNELYDAIKEKYPDIYDINVMFSMIGWRDALKYKLGDRFSFKGNIISNKDKEISMKDAFASYGAEQKNFTLSELFAFSESMGSTIYFDSLYKHVARISEERFVPRDDVSFQVKETDKVLGHFCTGNYLALPQIKNFGIFPEASHPWTPYLLEHYVAFHSKNYYLLHGGYNKDKVVGAIVKKEIAYESFDDLITDVIVESGVKLQKEDVLNYLFAGGYIARRTYSDIETLLIKARAKQNKKEK